MYLGTYHLCTNSPCSYQVISIIHVLPSVSLLLHTFHNLLVRFFNLNLTLMLAYVGKWDMPASQESGKVKSCSLFFLPCLRYVLKLFCSAQ